MRYDNLQFSVADDVLALGLRGAYLTIGGLKNRETDSAFEEIRQRQLDLIVSNLSERSIEEDRDLTGFRKLHEAVKRSNRKNVASPENLLSMLLRYGSLPRVNLLVDIYNLISVESRLALGAHDIAKISGNVTLRLTRGDEAFWPLGSPESKPVTAGEYAYIDDANDIICRLEVRQVEKTKVTLDTTECFYIVQGGPETRPSYIKATVDRLLALTKQFCGGEERILFAS